MLDFKYGHMYTGKSAEIIRRAHKSPNTIVMYADTGETHTAMGRVESRNNTSVPAKRFSFVNMQLVRQHANTILIDESQFLLPSDIFWMRELVKMVDRLDIVCYGLLRDYRDDLFPASQHLLRLADSAEHFKPGPYECDHPDCIRDVGIGFHRKVDDKWLVLCAKHRQAFD